MDVLIERHDRGGELELSVSGRLDAATSDELTAAVADELRAGHHLILLDLTGVTFLSSAGIRVLLSSQRSARSLGGQCLVRRASSAVRQVIDLARLAPLLLEGQASSPGARGETAGSLPSRAGVAADIHNDRLVLTALVHPPAAPLAATLHGSAAAALRGRLDAALRVSLPHDGFALGLAALADATPLAARAGEMVAACGAVFHRAPEPFATVDYLVGTGDLVAEVDIAAGLTWRGVPAGRCGFEPVASATSALGGPGESAVAIGDLIAALFTQSDAPLLAVVIAAEVSGLVAAELIRPLAAATDADTPLAADRDRTANWLSFSREPVHARRTTVVVGIASRAAPAAPLAEFLRPLTAGGHQGHFHAAVFPQRPLGRGGLDLATTVADIAATPPLAVLHLLDDPQPVLGAGTSQFGRGACWFAALDVTGGSA
jgi:anti-anti-sigma factor